MAWILKSESKENVFVVKAAIQAEVVQRRCLAVSSEHDEQDLLGGNTGRCTREAPQMKLVPSDRLPGLLGSWDLIWTVSTVGGLGKSTVGQ